MAACVAVFVSQVLYLMDVKILDLNRTTSLFFAHVYVSSLICLMFAFVQPSENAIFGWRLQKFEDILQAVSAILKHLHARNVLNMVD